MRSVLYCDGRDIEMLISKSLSKLENDTLFRGIIAALFAPLARQPRCQTT